MCGPDLGLWETEIQVALLGQVQPSFVSALVIRKHLAVQQLFPESAMLFGRSGIEDQVLPIHADSLPWQCSTALSPLP